jgi:hypothetical protein
MNYPYNMGLWDKLQRHSAERRMERERREAVTAYVQRNQQAPTENPGARLKLANQISG